MAEAPELPPATSLTRGSRAAGHTAQPPRCFFSGFCNEQLGPGLVSVIFAGSDWPPGIVVFLLVTITERGFDLPFAFPLVETPQLGPPQVRSRRSRCGQDGVVT
jgi:hypothetical protein